MIAGIIKGGPETHMLYRDEQCTDDNNPLTEYGLNGSTAKARVPATVELALWDPHTGKFETLEVTPLSYPTKLPDVIKAARGLKSTRRLT